jgi:hypothetical protein
METTTLTQDTEKRLRRIRGLTRLLEGAIKVPGTRWSFGLDPIIGLLPVGGDAISMAMSGYLMYEANALGAPKSLLTKMALNVAFDTVTGMVPLLGDAFDFFFKSNTRNLRLLEKWLADQRKADPIDA